MKSSEETGRRIEYTCPTSGLPVVELEAFCNLKLNEHYLFNVKKIGTSILYIHNRGNMKYSNIALYYETLERFCDAVDLEGPFIEIRDFSQLTGRTGIDQVKFQRDYILAHADKVNGFIICNAPFWVKSMVTMGIKTYVPHLNFAAASGYNAALEAAASFEKYQNPPQQRITLDAITFKPEWSYTNTATHFEYHLGLLIPGRLIFTKIVGSAHAMDVAAIQKTLEQFFHDAELRDQTYYKIADYSEVTHVSTHCRRLYAQCIRDVDEAFRAQSASNFIYGASASTIIQMKIFSLFTQQNTYETQNFNDAVKGYLANAITPAAPRKLVTESDIQEINNLCGSLIWPEYHPEDLNHSVLTPHNPLFQLKDTFEVVRQDMQELRAKDKQALTDLNTILDSIPIGIIIFNRKTYTILFVNSAASNMHERPTGQLLSTHYTSIISEEQQRELKKGRLPNHKEIYLISPTGSKRAVLQSIQPIQYRNQHCMLDAFTDISEQVDLKNQLRVTLKSTERVNNVMSGREDRIIELKQEVNALLQQLDQPKKYLKDLEFESTDTFY